MHKIRKHITADRCICCKEALKEDQGGGHNQENLEFHSEEEKRMAGFVGVQAKGPAAATVHVRVGYDSYHKNNRFTS